ncbi:MAG: ketopantoate reductase family protein [Acidobacteriota bacterium]
MRILVIGAGAVGGYFGGRLTAAGRDVTLLVRPARAEQIRANGLQILSPISNITVHPKLMLASDLRNGRNYFDLIILSTKAYSLETAMDDFAPAVGPKTSILPLLNGMRHLETLIARFGEEPVLGGSTRIVSDVDAEGRIVHLDPLQDLVFGERDRSYTPRAQAIASALHYSGFDDKLSLDIMAFMWQKWVFLAALGAITCLMRASIGEVNEVPVGNLTAVAILAECEAIAKANGYPTRREVLEVISGRLTDPTSTLTASMYRDLQRGKPVEADAILGDLLERGRLRGVSAPFLQAAYAQLSVYESLRTRPVPTPESEFAI